MPGQPPRPVRTAVRGHRLRIRRGATRACRRSKPHGEAARAVGPVLPHAAPPRAERRTLDQPWKLN